MLEQGLAQGAAPHQQELVGRARQRTRQVEVGQAAHGLAVGMGQLEQSQVDRAEREGV